MEDTKTDGTVLDTLRKVQSRQLSPQNISLATRRSLVEHLSSDGYSVAEMAEILQVNERTVRRDRAAVREANALEFDPELSSKMAGALLGEADNVVNRIRRAARAKDTTVAEKIAAEATCWRVKKELVESLQSLGHLPTAPAEVRGWLVASLGIGVPTGPELMEQLTRIAAVAREAGGDFYDKVIDLQERAEVLELAEDIEETRSQLDRSSKEDDDGC